MNFLLTETAYRDLWTIAERMAIRTTPSALAFVDGLDDKLKLIARRFEASDNRPKPSDPDAIRFASHGKYMIFYNASETTLTVLHLSDSAAEIERAIGDRWPDRSRVRPAGTSRARNRRRAAKGIPENI